jgi:hypothetical protein
VHFRLIQIDLLLVVDELLEEAFQGLIYGGVLIIELRGIANIWHAIDICFLEGVILVLHILFPLTVLFHVFPSYFRALGLSNANYNIFGPLSAEGFAGIKIGFIRFDIAGDLLFLQVHGQFFLFDKIIGGLHGEGVHVHLQFIIVDDLVAQERIEATPILKIAIHFSDLWD